MGRVAHVRRSREEMCMRQEVRMCVLAEGSKECYNKKQCKKTGIVGYGDKTEIDIDQLNSKRDQDADERPFPADHVSLCIPRIGGCGNRKSQLCDLDYFLLFHVCSVGDFNLCDPGGSTDPG